MSPAEQAEQNHQPEADGQSPERGAIAGSIEAASGNIDKIRDILFGANMRDYDARFSRLEEALMKEAAELRESTRRRFETLENYVKKEVDALQARLRSERDERSDALRQQSRDLQETNEALNRKIHDLEDHTTSEASGLRQDILNQSRTLMDELSARHQEIVSLLERRFNELQHRKTDRAALGSLLSEIALRLNDEFRIPGSDK
jgi:DNA repair exonuclease SbcCD ATPase subunit